MSKREIKLEFEIAVQFKLQQQGEEKEAEDAVIASDQQDQEASEKGTRIEVKLDDKIQELLGGEKYCYKDELFNMLKRQGAFDYDDDEQPQKKQK